MNHIAEIIVELDIRNDVKVDFNDAIAVSLDCDHCQRTHRTVGFELGADSAVCWVRKGVVHPPFIGRLVDKVVVRENGKARVTYRLEYDSHRFVDAKYDYRKWTGGPTWGRVGWKIICPACGGESKHCTQTNMVRPITRACCGCKHVLGVEREEMPIMRWLDSETNEWRQTEARFPPR